MGGVPSKISPLAPKTYPQLTGIDGVRLAAVEAGIKYQGRKDLALMLFEKPAAIAGVFTRSKCPSAPVDWCRKNLSVKAPKVRAIVINSGNANAFTGKKGAQAVNLTAKLASDIFGCRQSEVFLASTGVIGEPLDASGFGQHLKTAAGKATAEDWQVLARAIMTTDTYPKLATQTFEVKGKRYRLNGVAKGAGMIAPDMATMLSFLVTDYPVSSGVLQKLLKKAVKNTFNAVTVDSDTSTSDTVLFASAHNGRKAVDDMKDAGVRALFKALERALHVLAMQIVRDGEGATKHIEVAVRGATSAVSAKRIAMSIANSPLVKTAIAGEDANWGRIVMAVGKAGEPADRDRLHIAFNGITVATAGERAPDYDETAVAATMKREEILIEVDLGMGKGHATVWTCDLTADYIAINADYRS